MNSKNVLLALGAMLAGSIAFASSSLAQQSELLPTGSCPTTYAKLKAAVNTAANEDSTGFNNEYWAAAVTRGGVVCAVAYSGPGAGSQWLGSRQIAAAKAYTANAFSLSVTSKSGPLSTAQLYGFAQPSPSGGNPLFGLEGGNVLSDAAYIGDYSTFGTEQDPMVGRRVGGTITFGGGLALYNGGALAGAVGVSGDTACADHSVAWRIRRILNMKGPETDTITLVTGATPATGGHPNCPNSAGTQGQTPTATN